MRGMISIQRPEQIEMTLTVTLTLKQWKELRDQVSETWPGWEFRNLITDLVNKAETHFEAKTEESE